MTPRPSQATPPHDTPPQATPPQATRRTVLLLAGGTAAGAGLLTGCGTNAPDQPAGTEDTPADGETTTVPAAEVPVGGGVVLANTAVITQPTEGQFLGFSTVCTRQGCQVGRVEDGQIICPCHMSSFSITDGAVTGGPATAPLPAVAVELEGDRIIVG